jgi:threonine/homoserine/homoserine lactone efflux protein
LAAVTFLLLGAGIGFVAGVSPGPVLTLVVTQTLRGGWLRGAAVATGPLLADGPIVVLAAGLLSQLPGGFVPAISLVGGLFLLYLAVTTGLNGRRAAVPRGEVDSARGGFVTGLLGRALSPNPYLFWFLVGGPALIQARQVGWFAVAAFLVGYYTTIVGSNVGLALVVHRSIGLLSDRIYGALLMISSLILAVYALVLIGRGAQALRLEPLSDRGLGQ